MFLGIDFGTSSVKAVLVDGAQQVLGSAAAPLTVSRPAPGHSEQDPRDWWQALLDVLDTLHAAQPAALAAVQGIGLSGQMHGAVLLDAAGDVLRPCILWNDVRAVAECRELEAACPDLHAIAGNLAMPGFTAPKLLWVRRHEPAVFARTAHVLLPKAWIRYRLTGAMIEEMSDASGTLWLDVGRRQWSPDVLAATGLTRAAMPDLVEGSAPAGVLRQCRRRGRVGRHPSRRCLRLARHLGGAVGDHGSFRPVSAGRRPRVLPRLARAVAPDGRDLVGGGLAGLVGGRHRPGRGGADRRDGHPQRAERRPVPALPVG
jgi:glycerol kinase